MSEIATVEQSVRSEGRTLNLVLAPIRSAVEKIRKEEAARLSAEAAEAEEREAAAGSVEAAGTEDPGVVEEESAVE